MTDFYEVTDGTRKPKDARLVVYEVLETAAAVLVLAALVRFFLLQAFTVPSASMAGTLLPGDRILGNRIVYGLKIPFSDRVLLRFKSVRPGEIVIFREPVDAGRRAVRRVLAVSGMRVHIVAKAAYVNHELFSFPASADPGDRLLIEEKFSPRDNLREIRLPEAGETVNLDTLSLPEFDFYASLIRQENPLARISVTNDMMKDSVVFNDIKLPELKTELLKSDSSPNFDAMDWIELNNILNFLASRDDSSRYGFRRTLYMDGGRIGGYTVKGRSLFLIGDNWDESFDSRFYGFVSEARVVARASFIFFSSEDKSVRWRRLFHFI